MRHSWTSPPRPEAERTHVGRILRPVPCGFGSPPAARHDLDRLRFAGPTDRRDAADRASGRGGMRHEGRGGPCSRTRRDASFATRQTAPRDAAQSEHPRDAPLENGDRPHPPGGCGRSVGRVVPQRPVRWTYSRAARERFRLARASISYRQPRPTSPKGRPCPPGPEGRASRRRLVDGVRAWTDASADHGRRQGRGQAVEAAASNDRGTRIAMSGPPDATIPGPGARSRRPPAPPRDAASSRRAAGGGAPTRRRHPFLRSARTVPSGTLVGSIHPGARPRRASDLDEGRHPR